MGAPPALIANTSWLKDALATQAMTTVPPCTLEPRPDSGLPFERRRTFRQGQ
jgi:hypothetical protein